MSLLFQKQLISVDFNKALIDSKIMRKLEPLVKLLLLCRLLHKSCSSCRTLLSLWPLRLIAIGCHSIVALTEDIVLLFFQIVEVNISWHFILTSDVEDVSRCGKRVHCKEATELSFGAALRLHHSLLLHFTYQVI